MNAYDVAFLLIVAVVAWRTRHDRRAGAWLACGAASYVVSAVYIRMGGPSPTVMAAVCDAAVAFLIYNLARYRWELGLGLIFQAMLGINIIALAAPLFVSGLPISSELASLWHNAHAGMLDLANASALAWIGLNGAVQAVGGVNGGMASRPPRRGFRGALLALHRQRKHPPFWTVAT